jgi:hypothetical protein
VFSKGDEMKEHSIYEHIQVVAVSQGGWSTGIQGIDGERNGGLSIGRNEMKEHSIYEERYSSWR